MKDANPLGKVSNYPVQYDPSVLYPVERARYREKIRENQFSNVAIGQDLWNCYEFSWLDNNGVPNCAVLQLSISAKSPAIVESKSLKLYLGSFSQEKFKDTNLVRETLKCDLSKVLRYEPIVNLIGANSWNCMKIIAPPGVCIDNQIQRCDAYQYDNSLLQASKATHSDISNNIIYSELFRSLCPVTNQPDWATVIIGYSGGKWDYEQLGKYLVSFRNHNGFHEHCCETIFTDLLGSFNPDKLCVECRFTRRGGIDINPIRMSEESFQPWNLDDFRLARQ